MTTFFIVLIGWIFSLCLHEYFHAAVAFRGGDWTVKEKGYLSFNPLKYTHPLYSIILPVVFLMLGGLGLPGGAVYIETWRLKNRNWETYVSLAGPLANLIVAIALGIVLRIDAVANSALGPTLAFLGFLQVSALLFNLIPIPPFDGYRAIAPHLASGIRAMIEPYANLIFFGFMFIMWNVSFINAIFWYAVRVIAELLGVPLDLVNTGYSQFFFWR